MIQDLSISPSEIIEILSPFLSAERLSRIEEVVSARTRSVVTVVEGVANTGNVSAVMRSVEGLGFFEAHLINSGGSFNHSKRSSQGAEKWMDVTEWSSATECVDGLVSRGYRIIATSPAADAVPLESIDFTRRTAVVFGNELDGVSSDVASRCDEVVRIALNGFVESYNISVAAAICMYHAYRDRMRRQGFHGDLQPEERQALTATYCMRAVQHGQEIVAEARRRRKVPPVKPEHKSTGIGD